jgi:hypothetical protein
MAPRVRVPVWRPAVPAVAIGAMFAGIGLSSRGTLVFFLCIAVITLDNATQLRRGTRPLPVWRTSARVMAVAYIALIALAGVTALALVWDDTWTWVNAAIGVVVAVATFAIFNVWNARLARPLQSRATDIPQLDATLADPLVLRIMATLASYQGHIETVVLEEALEAPATEVGPALAPLVAAGYAEYTRPDVPWGRERIWLRATLEGRAAFDGHVAALRAATA